MLAMHSATLANGASTEIAPSEFTPIGPRLKPMSNGLTELLVKSTDQPIVVRLDGTAGDAINGSLSRIIFDGACGARALRKCLDGTLIAFGAEVIRLGFSGVGDHAPASASHTYHIELDADVTLAQITAAIAVRLTSSAGVATATINGASKAAGTIYIHDSAAPATALTATIPAKARQYVRAEGPHMQAGFPIDPAECPARLANFDASVITIHVPGDSDAVVVLSAQVN